jgi:hypothetical protein
MESHVLAGTHKYCSQNTPPPLSDLEEICVHVRSSGVFNQKSAAALTQAYLLSNLFTVLLVHIYFA